MYTTYVLYSVKYDKMYIGMTSDLTDRLQSHNELATKGYTIKYRPWQVVYTEIFTTKLEALRREKELKSSRGRVFIREHILQNFITK